MIIRTMLAMLMWAALATPGPTLATDRTAVVEVDGTAIVIPVPEGYGQVSVEWPGRMRGADDDARRPTRHVETLVSNGCMRVVSPLGCPTAYVLRVFPGTMSSSRWPAYRESLIALSLAEREKSLAEVQQSLEQRPEAVSGRRQVTLDQSQAGVLFGEDDPRSVRLRLVSPNVVRTPDGENRQWSFGAMTLLRGRVFNVKVQRDFPVDQDPERIRMEMEAELEAFMSRLYTLNPMVEAR